MAEGRNRILWDRMVTAHPDLTNPGQAGLALADDNDLDPGEVRCPACGVLLTEEHVPT